MLDSMLGQIAEQFAKGLEPLQRMAADEPIDLPERCSRSVTQILDTSKEQECNKSRISLQDGEVLDVTVSDVIETSIRNPKNE